MCQLVGSKPGRLRQGRKECCSPGMWVWEECLCVCSVGAGGGGNVCSVNVRAAGRCACVRSGVVGGRCSVWCVKRA